MWYHTCMTVHGVWLYLCHVYQCWSFHWSSISTIIADITLMNSALKDLNSAYTHLYILPPSTNVVADFKFMSYLWYYRLLREPIFSYCWFGMHNSFYSDYFICCSNNILVKNTNSHCQVPFQISWSLLHFLFITPGTCLAWLLSQIQECTHTCTCWNILGCSIHTDLWLLSQ
jgi:hypothetical protein